MSSDGVTEADEGTTGAEDDGEADDDRPDRVEFLLVTAGKTTLAVEVGRVGRIARDPPVTRVPRSPPAVRGVTSVGGDVRTVVDAGGLLGVDVRAEKPAVVLLDRDGGGQPFGLVVDDVVGIEHRPVDALTPVERADLEANCGLFRAAIDGDEPIGVLDAEAVASTVLERNDPATTHG